MRIVPGRYSGKVKVPASKSDGQRAILAAGLAKGRSKLIGVGSSDDERTMLRNIEALGAKVEIEQDVTIVIGTPSFPRKAELNLGESGLGGRLVTALCVVHSGDYKLTGEGTLIHRPFHFFKEYFQNEIPEINDTDGHLPLHIKGGYDGGTLNVSGKLSSQYISGLLMALPFTRNDSLLIVDELNSGPYVSMTLDTLKRFGVNIDHKDLNEFEISGNQEYTATEYTIESDWSSASYWLVASALGMDITVEGLSQSSFQADKAIISAFLAANCRVDMTDDSITIIGSDRKPFEFDATDCPDLFPALVSLAALTEGETRVFGLHRLAHKESNRGLTLQSEFEKIGIEIDLNSAENCMVIHGRKEIEGGNVTSHGDHRIAMSLGIVGMFSKAPIIIENSEAVSKSYPNFWEQMDGLKT